MKIIISLLILSLTIFSGCKKDTQKKLIIFHAGSLSIPFKSIAKEFEKSNPGVKVILEAAGSRVCARKISELGKNADIMASADYTVINNLLIPKFAQWNIRFAGNEMVIAYNDKSKDSKKINSTNWYKFLSKSDVVYGRSDPNSDPCGYRSLMVIKLSENFYKEKNLAVTLMEKDKNQIRPKETDLLALLEVNEIDYLFIYRSVAVQHKLKFITLPDKINLKLKKFSKLYSTVEVKISGKKPGSFTVKKGAPMVYGVTIPKNSQNPQLAKKFIHFLLNKNHGLEILERLGQKSMIPSPSSTFAKIPNPLKKYALIEK
jgi:molybdate/tungstate transport system substrate-binding protein